MLMLMLPLVLLLRAALTRLIRTHPLPLDGPRAHALVRRVIAREMAVLDQAATGVAAGEVDDFELCGVRRSVCVEIRQVGMETGCMYLTHLEYRALRADE